MMLSQTGQADAVREFAGAVGDSLRKVGQRELPSMYLYDELGTALFEAITLLPEYGLTRAEERLLRLHAGDMLEYLPPPVAVIELGSGSGRKTRWILEALADREPVAYFPIDISAAALIKCHQELGHIGAISIVGLEKSYLEGLQEAVARRRPNQALLVLFLGSTIGNFDPPAAEKFLRDIRRHLKPGDALLLGADVEKSVHDMLLAYDDPAGVTAAFNLNLLARVNRELGGDFDLACFAHEAVYDEEAGRIEMRLVSLVRQTVRVLGRDFAFAAGERIHTENSYKYRAEEFEKLLRDAEFASTRRWASPDNGYFVFYAA